ncbi:hypothetical protein DYH09_07380 [bacterium CPR1]|nr:hypothetical protein [bacterium CPR1]
MLWLRRLLVLIALVVVPLGFLQVYLVSYKVSDPKKAEQIYRDATARRMAVAPSAGPLASLLAKGSGADALVEFSSKSSRLKKDTLADPAFQAARARFESVMPALEAAALDPEQAWPNPDWPLGVLTVPLLESRNPFLSLSVLCQAQLLEGQPREAFKTALLSYRLAAPLTRQGPLIRAMAGQMTLRVACSSLNLVLLEKLEPADYDAAIKALEPQGPAQLLEVADLEYAWALDYLAASSPSQLVEGTGVSWVHRGLIYLPAYRERERKIVRECYLLARSSLETGRDNPQLSSQLAARAPYLAIPDQGWLDWNAVGQSFRYQWTRIEGLRAVAAIQLYRSRHGDYPVALADALGPAPRDWLGGQFVYERTQSGFRLLSSYPPEPRFPGLSFAPFEWEW